MEIQIPMNFEKETFLKFNTYYVFESNILARNKFFFGYFVFLKGCFEIFWKRLRKKQLSFYFCSKVLFFKQTKTKIHEIVFIKNISSSLPARLTLFCAQSNPKSEKIKHNLVKHR
jgi:hypothetical protein